MRQQTKTSSTIIADSVLPHLAQYTFVQQDSNPELPLGGQMSNAIVQANAAQKTSKPKTARGSRNIGGTSRYVSRGI